MTTTTASAPDFAAAAPRQSLKQRLQGLDNVLVVISSVLLPFGVLLVLLGWYGAARTPNLFEQVPYLISGGLLGLAFVVSGGLLYFSSWVAKAAQEQRASSAELLAALHEIRDELATRPAPEVVLPDVVPAQPRSRRSPGKASPNGASAQDGASRGDAPLLVATATGRMLHRTGCAVVVNRDDVHAVSPSTPGMQPCRLCDPLGAPRPARA